MIKLSEKDFLAQVVDYARLKGWMVAHFYDSRRSIGAGFPDLVLCKEWFKWEDIANYGSATLCFLELKREKGKPTQAQQEWLDILSKVPSVIAKCVHPSEWQEIEDILK